jgi:hypothetical protein
MSILPHAKKGKTLRAASFGEIAGTLTAGKKSRSAKTAIDRGPTVWQRVFAMEKGMERAVTIDVDPLRLPASSDHALALLIVLGLIGLIEARCGPPL